MLERIEQFLIDTRSLSATIVQLAGVADGWDVVRLRNHIDLTPSGTLPDGTSYSMHGYGVRFEAIDGREINFDWSKDGSIEFSIWDVQGYLESMGTQGDVEMIRSSLRALPHELVELIPLEHDRFRVLTE